MISYTRKPCRTDEAEHPGRMLRVVCFEWDYASARQRRDYRWVGDFSPAFRRGSMPGMGLKNLNDLKLGKGMHGEQCVGEPPCKDPWKRGIWPSACFHKHILYGKL
jgi:hypothetical protein